ncbi:MAG: alpha/beta hydrolase [Acidiferrobacterales bacterium]|nr:alpha/beta hydrolase [Acidiferrobacterales bacterium]
MASDALRLDTVDEFLVAQEAQYDDIVPGTESSVRWFDGVHKSDYSIIYLHGFSATNKEINPTIELLADELKANVYFARLTGHGRSDDAMLDGNVDAWFNDTRLAYRIGSVIGEKVIVVSVSTGGTLATWLLNQPQTDQISTNIMISPNYGIKNRFGGIVRWKWGLALAKRIQGPYYSFEPTNNLHRMYWTERYPIEALVPMFQLLDIVDELDKSKIKLPQLVIYSPEDQVVSPSKIEKTLTQFTSSKVTVERYEKSSDAYQHVLAGDATSPESTQEVVDIMANYVRSLKD